MIRLENTETYGWEAAIRGMRNPMNSWYKTDSAWFDIEEHRGGPGIYDGAGYVFVVGENDLTLMKNLSKSGDDHGKFLRMINVTVDITAPLYWYKEYDTYKVGTVANSCSTMHKIHSRELTRDDFSCEKLGPEELDILDDVIDSMNWNRLKFNATKDYEYWDKMIQLLPSSYNQKRTVQLNYQVLKHMYFARRYHKLEEWRTFCKWCETLPYFKEICIESN